MNIQLNEEEVETIRDILDVAWKAYPNNAGATFRHIRLLKSFGVLKERELLCHTCIKELLDRHAETCEEHKKYIDGHSNIPCPDSHCNFEEAEEATWKVNESAIYKAERKVLGEDRTHDERVKWLKETFPDIPDEARFNPWMGFFCDEHIGSMKSYANRI